MKKIALLVAVLLFSVTPAFAELVDMGKDVYDCTWEAEYRGSAVSRSNVKYIIISVLVQITDNQTTRDYYGVSRNVAMIGYLRYIDCAQLRWTTVRTMHWDRNKKVLFDSGIADKWNWIILDLGRNSMMFNITDRFCE